METAGEVAVSASPLLEEQPLVQPAGKAAPPGPLFFGLALLLELVWLSGIGYLLYWLLS